MGETKQEQAKRVLVGIITGEKADNLTEKGVGIGEAGGDRVLKGREATTYRKKMRLAIEVE